MAISIWATHDYVQRRPKPLAYAKFPKPGSQKRPTMDPLDPLRWVFTQKQQLVPCAGHLSDGGRNPKSVLYEGPRVMHCKNYRAWVRLQGDKGLGGILLRLLVIHISPGNEILLTIPHGHGHVVDPFHRFRVIAAQPKALQSQCTCLPVPMPQICRQVHSFIHSVAAYTPTWASPSVFEEGGE